MDDPHTTPQAADGGEGARRACDQCRLRKVRCDRRSPCANCITAKYHCSFSGSTSRIREQRHRVLISSQYEKKIDDLESRLDDITRLVAKIAEAQNRTTTDMSQVERRPTDTSTASIVVSPGSRHNDDGFSLVQGQDRLAALAEHAARQADTINAAHTTQPSAPQQHCTESTADFHGTSSVAAHASFAGKFVEDAVTCTTIASSEASDPHMRVALESLQQLLDMQRQHSVSGETHLQHVQQVGPRGLAGLPLPPLASVVDVLCELRERNTLTFTMICVFDSIEAFTDKCKTVYFATDQFSTATFISVCAGLYYLFQEKAAMAMQKGQLSGFQDGSEAEKYRSHCMTCRDNLETALAHLSLLQPMKQETVEALIMAESYATEISKPSLAWQLNATACQTVLAMGYHRNDYLPGETSDLARRRRAVRFWFVYILDRALALRFGRSPNLQNYDITLPRQIGPLDEPFQEHCATIQGWLRHAEVQGQIYETLYSPVALLKPLEQRVQSARACANILLEEVRVISDLRSRQLLHDNGVDGTGSIAAILSKADEVSLRSTLTLAYRAIPPGSLDAPSQSSSTFCTECIVSARDVIQLHFECIKMLESNPHLAPAYMHWTLLFSPFIPFIVLFCHAVENYDWGDLVRVKNFKSSLEPFRDVSEPVKRLHRLCEILSDVAELYFAARKTPSQYQDRSQQRQWCSTDFGVELAEGAENLPRLSHTGDLPEIDDWLLSGSSPYYPTNTEEQATQAANWYLDYVNMVGWSELSPLSGPGL